MLGQGDVPSEQELNDNTHELLDKNIGFYKDEEKDAHIPLMILNSVITRDLGKANGMYPAA